MRAGLLWFDDSPRTPLASKVDHAMRRYREKFGRTPNICYVHPRTLKDSGNEVTPIRVVGLPSIQPNHFWVGLI